MATTNSLVDYPRKEDGNVENHAEAKSKDKAKKYSKDEHKSKD